MKEWVPPGGQVYKHLQSLSSRLSPCSNWTQTLARLSGLEELQHEGAGVTNQCGEELPTDLPIVAWETNFYYVKPHTLYISPFALLQVLRTWKLLYLVILTVLEMKTEKYLEYLFIPSGKVNPLCYINILIKVYFLKQEVYTFANLFNSVLK